MTDDALDVYAKAAAYDRMMHDANEDASLGEGIGYSGALVKSRRQERIRRHLPGDALGEIVVDRPPRTEPKDAESFNTQRARLAALSRWSKEPDRIGATLKARQAFDARWEREVDPDGLLDPRERGRRAAYAKRAHFLRLAMKSAKARKKKTLG